MNEQMDVAAVDEVFSEHEQLTPPKPDKEIIMASLDELYPFPGHPFRVVMDADMDRLVMSIRNNGVLVPAIVRPRRQGGYEIIAGHRRKEASRLAGKPTMPVEIRRDMDDSAATIAMIETNLKNRQKLLPSEKAKAYRMMRDALVYQGVQLDGDNAKPGRSKDRIAEHFGESASKVMRMIRLTHLNQPLLEMVDGGKLKLGVAIQISYLDTEVQCWITDFHEQNNLWPTVTQIRELRSLFDQGALTQDAFDEVIGILCIAIGVTAGFILLPRSQRNEISMTQVVRLTQNVKAGEQLTAENLETTTIPAANVPSGASSSVDTYRGKYAVTQLFAGDILTATKVRDTLVDPVAAGAAKGKQLVSLTIPTLTAGVSGTLLPGDVVAVMVTSKITQFNQQLGLLVATEQSTITTTPESEDGEGEDSDGDINSGINQTLISSIQKESETYIPEELRYLEVCKVTSSDGTDALVNAAKDPDVPNRLPATITFYVTEEQALKLAEIEQNGDIHIAFLARGDAADVFIPREERVLVEEPIPEPTPTAEPTASPAETSTATQPTSEAPQETATAQATEAPTATSAPEATVEPAETETVAVTAEPAATQEPSEPVDPSEIDYNDPGVGE